MNDKKREYVDKWRKEHAEKCREYARQYYARNKKRLNDNCKKYYRANRDKCLKDIKEYYRKHKERLKEWQRLKSISQQGIFVITTATDTESPKWNKSLVCAPIFSGKKFGREFNVHLDFIGMVHQRTNEQGEILYPPLVSFKSPSNDFVAKWTGKHLKSYTGVLNLNKIFNLS